MDYKTATQIQATIVIAAIAVASPVAIFQATVTYARNTAQQQQIAAEKQQLVSKKLTEIQMQDEGKRRSEACSKGGCFVVIPSQGSDIIDGEYVTNQATGQKLPAGSIVITPWHSSAVIDENGKMTNVLPPQHFPIPQQSTITAQGS